MLTIVLLWNVLWNSLIYLTTITHVRTIFKQTVVRKRGWYMKVMLNMIPVSHFLSLSLSLYISRSRSISKYYLSISFLYLALSLALSLSLYLSLSLSLYLSLSLSLSPSLSTSLLPATECIHWPNSIQVYAFIDTIYCNTSHSPIHVQTYTNIIHGRCMHGLTRLIIPSVVTPAGQLWWSTMLR